MPFHTPWLTLDTMIEPDCHRIKPHTAPITAALTRNTGTCDRGGSKPVLRIASDQCHDANAMLLHIRTLFSFTPALFKDAHSHPRKKPSSVTTATKIVETAVNTKLMPTFFQLVCDRSVAPALAAAKISIAAMVAG